MSRWIKLLLRGAAELVVGSALALLLAWQALVVGVNDSLAACLVLCGSGIPIFFALLAAHELGHLLAGKALGLPFVRFTVGPLQLVREGERIRARLNTAWFQPAAYVMLALPAEGDRRWRWAAVLLGGPLSNLLLGAACLAAATGLNPGPPAERPHAARAAWRSVALLYPGNPAAAWLNVTASSSTLAAVASRHA